MSYVPKPDYRRGGAVYQVNLSDKPRLLTVEEINSIVNDLPKVQAGDPTAAQVATRELGKTLSRLLEDVVLAPSQFATYKETIYSMFERARATPGDTIGITAAEAVGAITTQMNLKSFHTAGSQKSMSLGISATREVLNASKERKSETYTIFFKQWLTFDEVLNMRTTLVGLYISRLVRDYTIDVPYSETNPQGLPRYWFHETFPLLKGQPLPTPSMIGRLYLKPDEMYRYAVTIEEIANMLEKEFPNSSIMCVYGTIADGIIDIYPYEDRLEGPINETGAISSDLAAQVFLKVVLLPRLDTIRLRGVEKITALEPVVMPVWQIVQNERQLSSLTLPRYIKLLNIPANQVPVLSQLVGTNTLWMLVLNESKRRVLPINEKRLSDLLGLLGIEILSVSTGYVMVRSPQGKPSTVLKQALDQDQKEIIEYEKVARGAKKPRYLQHRPISPLGRAANLVYAESLYIPITKAGKTVAATSSNGLYELFKHSYVNPEYTYTNNMHEMSRVFGIEAAYNLICKDLDEIIRNSDSYVNPRHVMTITEFICSLGVPNGINFTGITRQAQGALSMATFERPMKILTRAAIYRGEEETSVSVAIATGQEIPVGTGMVHLINDEKLIRQHEEESKRRSLAGALRVEKEDIEALKRDLETLIVQKGAEIPEFAEDFASPPDVIGIERKLVDENAPQSFMMTENRVNTNLTVVPAVLPKQTVVALNTTVSAPTIAPPAPILGQHTVQVAPVQRTEKPPVVDLAGLLEGVDFSMESIMSPELTQAIDSTSRTLISSPLSLVELKTERTLEPPRPVERGPLPPIFLPSDTKLPAEPVATPLMVVAPVHIDLKILCTVPGYNLPTMVTLKTLQNQYQKYLGFVPRTIVDGFAGIGINTLNLLQCYPGSTITAYEADAKAFDCLQNNIVPYRGRITVRNQTLIRDIADLLYLTPGLFGRTLTTALVNMAQTSSTEAEAIKAIIIEVPLGTTYAELNRYQPQRVDVENLTLWIFKFGPAVEVAPSLMEIPELPPLSNEIVYRVPLTGEQSVANIIPTNLKDV